MRIVLLLVALTTPGLAAPSSESRVAATRTHWAGDVIVTETDVVGADGRMTTVVSLGGTVDGIGMTFSHVPREMGSDPGSPGAASYGVQRTKYSGVPLWRDGGCLDFAHDSSTVPAATSKIIDQAFATWTSATASCAELEYRSHRTPATVGRDGASTIAVRSERWCRPATADTPELCYPPDAAAVTRLVFVDNPGDPEDGKILEADMELNQVTFALLAPGETAPVGKPSLDLLSVVTHEVGHVLGLAHDCATAESSPADENGLPVPSCDVTDEAVTTATMFYRLDAGDLSKRDLAPNDIAGACALVEGFACVTETTGEFSAGCNTGGRAGPLGLFALLAIRRRRRGCGPCAGARRRTC